MTNRAFVDMNKWMPWVCLRHMIIMNRKMPLVVMVLLALFLFTIFFEQNRIQEYSRYNWLQGNRELLSLRNSVANYKSNSSSTSLDSRKTNEPNEPNSRTAAQDKTDGATPKACQPKYNIVFLKTHKCASTTIQNIFMRNGFLHHKVFVLPATANYLGHPTPFSASLVPDPKQFHRQYNILTHHSRLDYHSMRSLMPNDTLFVTIVRNPVDLFESMFHYYRLDKFWNTSFAVFGDPDTPVPTKVHTNRYIGKIGINQMMFDLGMNSTDFTKPYAVKNYIKWLDSIFDLVMVSERMDESLVLLKHLLCWTTDDIIAFKLNARHTKTSLTETAAKRIHDLNWADTQLYKHFTQKFSLLVKAFGNEKMDREVNELKERTNQWFDYCVGSGEQNETQSDAKSIKKSIVVKLRNRQADNTTCWLLTAQEMDFTKFLRMRQMRDLPGSVFKDPKLETKNKPKTLSASERRKRILKSKISKLSPKFRSIVCKRYDCSETTTTTDSSQQLANALKDFTFRY